MPYEGKVEAESIKDVAPTKEHLGAEIWSSDDMKAHSSAWKNSDKHEPGGTLELTDPFKDINETKDTKDTRHLNERSENDGLNEKLAKTPEKVADKCYLEPAERDSGEVTEQIHKKLAKLKHLAERRARSNGEFDKPGKIEKPGTGEKPVQPLKPERSANGKPESGEKPPTDTRPEKPRPRQGKPILPSDKPTPSEIHSRKKG